MNNEDKAKLYNQLMFEYTKIQNQISSIKGESISLNQNQINEVRELERKLNFIMQKAHTLLIRAIILEPRCYGSTLST